MRSFFLLVLLCVVNGALAIESLDYALSARQVATNTYVFIGAKEDFTRDNGGNIVNTGFVITEPGVVVIDAGPSLRYGQQMRRAIAAITDKPVVKVLLTHHHPDHFLGIQAFAGIPVYALSGTISAIKRDADGFLDNVYRMSGDWMKGTEAYFDNLQPLAIAEETVGEHHFKYIALRGHTDADLMILDSTTGVLFAGDLVFHNRTLTTPHAEPEAWLSSLQAIQQVPFKIIVPGHGEVASDSTPVDQTRDYLQWLESTIRTAVEQGQEMNELLAKPIPERFKKLGVIHREFIRSVSHRFPIYEQQIFSQ